MSRKWTGLSSVCTTVLVATSLLFGVGGFCNGVVANSQTVQIVERKRSHRHPSSSGFQSQASPKAEAVGRSSAAEKEEEDSTSSSVIWQWEEQEDEEDPQDIHYFPPINQDDENLSFLESIKKPKRKLIWLGQMEDGSYNPSYDKRRRRLLLQQKLTRTTPHKLRMAEWNITFAWREKKRERESMMQFEFHENGFVRCQHPKRLKKSNDEERGKGNKQKKHVNEEEMAASSTSTTLSSAITSVLQKLNRKKDQQQQQQQQQISYVVGKWRLAPSGVIWTTTWDGYTYSFYADLHLNPFGKHPKFFRGMVLKDRGNNKSGSSGGGGILPPRFLRPLVATFKGFGDGEDTADLQYTNRNYGST